MSTFIPYLANSIWQASSKKAWLRFHQNARIIKTAQAQRLRAILQANQHSQWGQKYHFDAIQSATDFQKMVPLTTYDDYLPWIKQAAAGKPAVLTKDPIKLFELSSGSIAASKLIPYTPSLQWEFNQGIGAWIYDLFQHYPGLKAGRAYWSISPLSQQMQYTSGGIPIGFEEDSAYLGKMGGILENAVMAVPKTIKWIEKMDNFRYLTLFHLLRQENIRIISIWNPTFLTQLLNPLAGWWEQLLNDIQHGSLNLPHPVSPDIHKKLSRSIFPHPLRARTLSKISPDEPSSIWTELQLISCWMSGPSKSYAQRLQTQFTDIQFQPKGLIATEAFISFPLIGYTGSVLAINSHFFEFIPVGSKTETPLLADQLEIGQEYEVVVTTGGGFYRYQMNDIVEVVGFYQQVPLIEFVSKSNHISDWFGEKLNEAFVANICKALFQKIRQEPVFYLLAPEDTASTFRYTLYLECGAITNIEIFAHLLEQNLCENFHYKYARQLGQLAPATIKIIPPGGEQKYLAQLQSQGMRPGNIKPMCLSNKKGWGKVFG